MRGVILAGGKGTRLKEFTNNGEINKHLVFVNGIPMISYPLSTMKKMGIKDITVVTNAEDIGDIARYLTSNHSEIRFHYEVQKEAGGIAQALGLVEDVTKNSNLAVILGDNVFEENFYYETENFERTNGAKIFLKKVHDPERFGVVEIKGKRIVSIEEKPKKPKSDLMVTGLYFFDESVFEKIQKLKPSKRGEYEITDVIKMYLKQENLSYKVLESFWSDVGTCESLIKTEEYIKKEGIEKFVDF